MADLTEAQIQQARELADAVGYDLPTAMEIIAIQAGQGGCIQG